MLFKNGGFGGTAPPVKSSCSDCSFVVEKGESHETLSQISLHARERNLFSLKRIFLRKLGYINKATEGVPITLTFSVDGQKFSLYDYYLSRDTDHQGIMSSPLSTAYY